MLELVSRRWQTAGEDELDNDRPAVVRFSFSARVPTCNHSWEFLIVQPMRFSPQRLQLSVPARWLRQNTKGPVVVPLWMNEVEAQRRLKSKSCIDRNDALTLRSTSQPPIMWTVAHN
jgi:hypothetical protein